jgi:hypothetical protein
MGSFDVEPAFLSLIYELIERLPRERLAAFCDQAGT